MKQIEDKSFSRGTRREVTASTVLIGAAFIAALIAAVGPSIYQLTHGDKKKS